jgi:capsular polysaccharide biosynthesis protein
MEIDVKELLKFFISKIKIIILCTFIFAIIGIIYVNFIIVPMYHSSTTLILVSNDNSKNSTMLQSEVTLNKNLVATYSEIVKSRTVLTKVIDELHLDTDVANLSNQITVTSVENTEIIKIEVSDESAEKAQKIAKTTAEVFKDEVQKIYNLTNVSVVDKAYLAEKPYNINPIKQLTIFTCAGIVAGAFILFLIFYFDTSIKSSEEIEEKLSLPVVGKVVLVETKRGRRK